MKREHEQGQAEQDVSGMRKDLVEAVREMSEIVAGMLRPGRMIRGTVYWHQREGEEETKRYPALSRKVAGQQEGRRVRLEDAAWVEEMVERHRRYRDAQTRVRRLGTRINALLEALRYTALYDYEPQREEEGRRVKVNREKGHAA